MNDFKLFKNENLGIIGCYNTREKIYKNGTHKLKKSSYDTFVGKISLNQHNGTSTDDELQKYVKRHLKEKKEKILDLALNNNHWKYFVTLTFDKESFKNGIYNHEEALTLLSKFIDNQKHQNPYMSYLMVAEFHKSGQLHFHGLFANVSNWNLQPARNPKTNRLIYKNGKQIFNLINYKIGFTTVSYVESQEKVSSYISKYITKQLITLKFKKAYWYSRDLEKPKLKFHYYENDLKDIYQDNITYTDKFIKGDCSIELLNFQGIDRT